MPLGGLNVGSIHATAGLRIDQSGFVRWRNEFGKVKAEARSGAEARLDAKHDPASFDRYHQAIQKAKREALKGVTTKLEADEVRSGFQRYERALDHARSSARHGANAELGAHVDLSGFRRWRNELNLSNRGIARMHTNIGGLSSSIGGRGLGLVGGAGLAGALTAGVTAGVKFNAQIESGTLALSRYAGGTDKARKFVLQLAADAEKTPFELTDLLTGTRRLASFGLELDKSRELLRNVADAVAQAGGSAEHIDRVTIALGQMQARGKVSGEELLQLTEAGIPAQKILQRELHLSGEEMGKIGELGIKSEVAIEALSRGLKKDFGGAAEEQSRTFDGMMSTLRDNWARTTGSMTVGLFGALKKWTPEINRTLADVRKIFERNDLSFGDKIEKSIETAKVNLGPVAAEIKRELDKVDFTKGFNDALNFAAPRVANAAGRIGLAIAKATLTAIVESDFLGRAFILGYITKKLGLWRAAGVLLGRQMGIGVTAGAATTAAAAAAPTIVGPFGQTGPAGTTGGRGPGAGRLARLGRFARFGGITAAGFYAADQVFGAIDDRQREQSSGLGERLGGLRDRSKGERLGAVFGDGGFTESGKAKQLQAILADVQQKHKAISESTAQEARDLAEQLHLTEQQRDQVGEIVDVGRARAQLRRLAREAASEGINVKVNIDTPGRSTELLRSLQLMREGVFTTMRDINREVSVNSKRIGETLGAETGKGRHALVENFQSAIANVGIAMQNGEISTGRGMRRIRQLLRSIKLVEGDDPFGLGKGFARSIDKAGGASKRVVNRVIGELKQMPAGARAQAVATMVATATEMERRHRLPAGSVRKLKAAVLAQFRDMRTRGAVNAGGFVADVAVLFGQLPKVSQPGIVGLFGLVNNALKELGAQKIDLPKLLTPKGITNAVGTGLALLRAGGIGDGNARGGIIRRARGGLIPGSGVQDSVVMRARRDDAIVNRHQAPLIDFALRASKARGEQPYASLGAVLGAAAAGGTTAERDVLAAPGEYHIPREKRGPLDRALASTKRRGQQPAGSLEDVFGLIHKPHYEPPTRFARGGMVDPAWDPGGEVLNAAISEKVGRWAKTYSANMTAGYDPGGGHVSPGHNVTGTATDMVPRAGWGAAPTTLFERGLKALVAKGVKVLYGTAGIGLPWPNHGRGNHAHIEWSGAKGDFGAPALEALPRLRFAGPDGPMRDLAQAATDTVRKAAQTFIDKRAGEVSGPIGGDAGRAVGGLSKAQLKRLWTSADGPARYSNLAAAIALAESGGRTGKAVHSPNPGGGINRGPWQIWSGHKDSTDDPLGNARAAVRISKGGTDWSQWEAYENGNYRQFLARGGIIGRLAEFAGFAPGGSVDDQIETERRRLDRQSGKKDDKKKAAKPKAKPPKPIWSGGRKWAPDELDRYKDAHGGKSPAQVQNEDKAERKRKHRRGVKRQHKRDDSRVKALARKVEPGVEPPDLFSISGYDPLLDSLQAKVTALGGLFARNPAQDALLSREEMTLPNRLGHAFLDIGKVISKPGADEVVFDYDTVGDITAGQERIDQLGHELRYQEPQQGAIEFALKKMRTLVARVDRLTERYKVWVRHLRGALRDVRALRREKGKDGPRKSEINRIEKKLREENAKSRPRKSVVDRLEDDLRDEKNRGPNEEVLKRLKGELRDHADAMGLPRNSFIGGSHFLAKLEPELERDLEKYGTPDDLIKTKDDLTTKLVDYAGAGPAAKTGDPVLDAIGGGAGGRLGEILGSIADARGEQATLTSEGLRQQLLAIPPNLPRPDEPAEPAIDFGKEQQGLIDAIVALGREFGSNIQSFRQGGVVRGPTPGSTVLVAAEDGEVFMGADGRVQVSVNLPKDVLAQLGAGGPTKRVYQEFSGPVTQVVPKDQHTAVRQGMWEAESA